MHFDAPNISAAEHCFGLPVHVRKSRDDSIKNMVERLPITFVHGGNVKTKVFQMRQSLARVVGIGDAQIVVDEQGRESCVPMRQIVRVSSRAKGIEILSIAV